MTIFQSFLDRKAIVQTFIVSWFFFSSNCLNNFVSAKVLLHLLRLSAQIPAIIQSVGHRLSTRVLFKAASASVSDTTPVPYNCWIPNLRIFSVTWRFLLQNLHELLSTFSSVRVAFSHTTIHLKGTKGCDNNNCIWRCWQACVLISRNFSAPRSAPKTSFSNSVISQVKGCCRRQNRVTASGAILANGPMCTKVWYCKLLNQVWLNTSSFKIVKAKAPQLGKITYRNRRTVSAINANNDTCQTTLVLDVRCQAKNCQAISEATFIKTILTEYCLEDHQDQQSHGGAHVVKSTQRVSRGYDVDQFPAHSLGAVGCQSRQKGHCWQL